MSPVIVLEGEVWAQDYKMQTLVHLNSQDLYSEATDCRLYKHCGRKEIIFVVFVWMYIINANIDEMIASTLKPDNAHDIDHW